MKSKTGLIVMTILIMPVLLDFNVFGNEIKPECSSDKIQEIIGPATSKNANVYIDCRAVLPKNSKITKRLLFTGESATGTLLDCNGGSIDPSFETDKDTILIYSKIIGDDFFPPNNIQIRNCELIGTIRIRAGTSDIVKASSQKDKHHRARMQKIAPHNILIEQMKISPKAGTHLYVGTGVTYVTLKNSELLGSPGGPSIYLDSESAYHLIYRNIFNYEAVRGNSGLRENIAIDGSAYNTILENRFYSLKHGGIMVYRNCGETGIVRVQGPMYNHIINNHFYYSKESKKGSERRPAIWLGSRQGSSHYCDQDSGYSYGSSISDLDFAKNNVIAQNQVFNRTFQHAFVNNDTYNVLIKNKNSVTPLELKSGCYLNNEKVFINNGVNYKIVLNKNGKKTTVRVKCQEGFIVERK